MRTPYFIAAEQKEEMPEKERDLHKILKESDEKAKKLLKRHDSNRPDASKEERGLPPEGKENQ